MSLLEKAGPGYPSGKDPGAKADKGPGPIITRVRYLVADASDRADDAPGEAQVDQDRRLVLSEPDVPDMNVC